VRPLALIGLVGVALGIAYLAASSTLAPAPTPAPKPGPGRRYLGDAALVNDVVSVSPTALTNLFNVPAGATAILMTVTAASADLLTGTVVGVTTPLGDQAVGGAGSFTVPRSAVTRIQRNGRDVALAIV
jgi:hypothetical protein